MSKSMAKHSHQQQLRGCMLTLLILCPGCAVGPDFSPPEPPVPIAWHSIPATTQAILPKPGAPIDVAWWTGYGDPTLTSLIERGMLANFDVQGAAARLRQARAAVSAQSASLWPQLNASSEYRRSDSSGAFSNTSSSSARGSGASDLFQAGFDAVWELDIFGGTRRNVEAAEAGETAAVEDTRSVLISVQAEIASSYLRVRGIQKELNVAKANLEIQQSSARISNERYSAGFASKLDVATADAEVASTAAQIPVLESALQQEFFALAVLLGLEPAALIVELEQPAPIPLPNGEIPIGLPSEILKRRPDIRRAEAQLHLATARIGVATADLYPKFSLSAFFGIEGETVGSLSDWKRGTWSMGSSALMPLFDAGRIRASIAVENAAQEEALAQYQQTVLTALKEVESALVSLSAEQRRFDSLQTAVTANRSALTIAKQLYSSGLTEFITVLTAERSLFASESALAQSERAIGLSAVALFKSLGGGWRE